MRTFNFKTTQKGYGRQGLSFEFDGEYYHIADVFPNVPEHFNEYELLDNCFYNEDTDTYSNSNGREVTPINSWDEFLTNHYKEEIGSVLFESLDFDDYDFDFNSATYDEITEWALNYE